MEEFRENNENINIYSVLKQGVQRLEYKCNLCSRLFPRKCYLNLHLKYHIFKCTFCPRRYMKKSQLRRHVNTVHKPSNDLNTEEKYYCDKCDIILDNKYFYKRHIWQYHRGVYVCQRKFCGVICIGKENYDMHKKTHQFYTCIHCGKSVKYLHAHMKTHLKSYRCELCQKNFSFRINLQRHMLIHLKMKPFCCSDCGWKFRQKSGLEDHMKTHTREKCYSCKVCDVNFVRFKTLKFHEKRAHRTDKLKKYHCNSCSFTASDLSCMKKHKEDFHGDILKCKICLKMLSCQQTLNTHLDTHKKTKQYSCSICIQEYSSKSTLTKHQKRFHPQLLQISFNTNEA